MTHPRTGDEAMSIDKAREALTAILSGIGPGFGSAGADAVEALTIAHLDARLSPAPVGGDDADDWMTEAWLRAGDGGRVPTPPPAEPDGGETASRERWRATAKAGWATIAEQARAIADLEQRLAEAARQRDGYCVQYADSYARAERLARDLAEARSERDALVHDVERAQAAASEALTDLAEARKRIGVAVEALEIIAGRRQCLDNLMGNRDVAEQALVILLSPALTDKAEG